MKKSDRGNSVLITAHRINRFYSILMSQKWAQISTIIISCWVNSKPLLYNFEPFMQKFLWQNVCVRPKKSAPPINKFIKRNTSKSVKFFLFLVINQRQHKKGNSEFEMRESGQASISQLEQKNIWEWSIFSFHSSSLLYTEHREMVHNVLLLRVKKGATICTVNYLPWASKGSFVVIKKGNFLSKCNRAWS